MEQPSRQAEKEEEPKAKVILTRENLVSRLEALPLDGEDVWSPK